MKKTRLKKSHYYFLILVAMVSFFGFNTKKTKATEQQLSQEINSNASVSVGEEIQDNLQTKLILKIKSSLPKESPTNTTKQNKYSSTDFKLQSISSELLQNGDFESGHLSWDEMTYSGGSLYSYPYIIRQNGYPANGTWYAFMDTSDYLVSNQFTLPANSTNVTLSYNADFEHTGTCTVGQNKIFASLHDETTHEAVGTLMWHDANTEASDTQYYYYSDDSTMDLSTRGGHQMTISFLGANDDPSCSAYIWLDDVSLTAITSDIATHTPMYRLYNTRNGAYLYTRGDPDRLHVLDTWSDFEFTDGVPAFYASLTTQSGLTPMYRLYNTKNGAYLYARGDADKSHVLNTWPEFEFTDGVPAFYASLTTQSGLTPIYRLYNTLNGMYLYTRGDADKAHVMNTWPEFEFTDGVPAFYASLN
jgi:hypothetical protein